MSASTRLRLAVILASWFLPPGSTGVIFGSRSPGESTTGTENWPDALEDPDRRIAHPSAPAMDILESLAL